MGEVFRTGHTRLTDTAAQHVVLVGNSSSGRGRAFGHIARIGGLLEAEGHKVVRVETGPNRPSEGPTGSPARSPGGSPGGGLNGELRGAKALIVAGGDGTIHHALEHAVEADVPIYHLPSGNENLFAREFGMDATWDRLRRSLNARNVVESDLGACNGKLFALMVSVGFDASVVERVALARTGGGRGRGARGRGGVTHADYALQAWKELWTAKFIPLRVEVDGRVLVDGERGLLVVANSRQYGGGLDPARDARIDDGLLNVVFLPASSRLALLRWAARLAWSRGLSRVPKTERGRRAVPGARCLTGERVWVHPVDGTVSAQVDGEYLGRLGSESLPALDIQIRPRVLSVLSVR